MPSFDYLALDTAGREKRGTIDGETLVAARERLDARRLYVVRIAPGWGGTSAAVRCVTGRPLHATLRTPVGV